MSETASEKRERFEKTALPFLPAVHGAARRLTRNSEDARELAQETFLRAFRTFAGFRPGTNCKAWLLTILYSIFVNRYHKEKRAPRTVSLEGLEERLAAPPEPAGPAGGRRSGRTRRSKRRSRACPRGFSPSCCWSTSRSSRTRRPPWPSRARSEPFGRGSSARGSSWPPLSRITRAGPAISAGRGILDERHARTSTTRSRTCSTGVSARPSARRVEEHLAACAACGAARDRLVAVKTAVWRALRAQEVAVARFGRDHGGPRPGAVGRAAAPVADRGRGGGARRRCGPRDARPASRRSRTRRPRISRGSRTGSLALEASTSDAAALERFFEARGIPFRTRVLDLGMMGYRLIGGRVHSLRGQTFGSLRLPRRRGGGCSFVRCISERSKELPSARASLRGARRVRVPRLSPGRFHAGLLAGRRGHVCARFGRAARASACPWRTRKP